MTDMIARARRWLDERTARERWMLGLCALLVLLLLGWLLVYRPLHGWRLAQADVRAAAQSREAGVRAAAARLAGQRAPAFEGDLEAVARQRAEAAGLEATFGMSETGGLGFLAERTSSGAALAWLADLEQAGVRVVSLSVVENADATVTAQGALARDDATNLSGR